MNFAIENEILIIYDNLPKAFTKKKILARTKINVTGATLSAQLQRMHELGMIIKPKGKTWYKRYSKLPEWLNWWINLAKEGKVEGNGKVIGIEEI